MAGQLGFFDVLGEIGNQISRSSYLRDLSEAEQAGDFQASPELAYQENNRRVRRALKKGRMSDAYVRSKGIDPNMLRQAQQVVRDAKALARENRPVRPVSVPDYDPAVFEIGPGLVDAYDAVAEETPAQRMPVTSRPVGASQLDYTGAAGVPEYTPEYVNKAVADVESGRYDPERIGRDALWTAASVPMTALQMGLNAANPLLGGALDPLINRYNEGTDIIKNYVASPQLLESERAVQQQIADGNFAGTLGTMAENPGWLLSEAVRNMGSMAVPAGIAGGTVRAAQALPWLGRLLPTAERAAGIGSQVGNVAMNVGSTFSDESMQDLPLWKRYLAGGISGLGTALVGAATEGGAEGQLARSLFGREANAAASEFNPFGLLTSAGKEAFQEGVEGGSDYLGQQVAKDEPVSLQEMLVQNLPDMIMGGITGAATHAGTSLRSGQQAQAGQQQPSPEAVARSLMDAVNNGGTADAFNQAVNTQQQAAQPRQQPVQRQAAEPVRQMPVQPETPVATPAQSASASPLDVVRENGGISRKVLADLGWTDRDMAKLPDGIVAQSGGMDISQAADALNRAGFDTDVEALVDYASRPVQEYAFEDGQQENTQQTAQEQPEQPVQVPETAQLTREDTQNRDRSSRQSIAQMNSIAGNPDYGRLGVGTDFGNGSPVVYGDDAFVAKGNTGTMVAADGRRIPFQYEVVEADRLIPSNLADGTRVAEYDTGAKGKLRAIAGNGRTAGLKEAYNRGTAGQYRAEMTADAGHGVPASAIKRMKHPVLVRVMPESHMTPDLADVSNTATNAVLTPLEQARNDARRIDIGALEFGDNGVSDQNVRDFVKSLPVSEQTALLSKDGMPTRQAEDRLMAAVFASAYDSDELIDLYAQAKDPESRNVLNGLASAAYKMVQLKGMGDFDVRSLVVEAAESAVNAQRRGERLEDYAATVDMVRSPETDMIIGMLVQNRRSARRIGEALQNLADVMANGFASQDSMFGDGFSRQEGLDYWRNTNYGTEQGSAGVLRQQGRAGTDEGGDVGQAADSGTEGEAARNEPEEPSRPVQEEGNGQPEEGLTLSPTTPDQLRAEDEARQAEEKRQAEEERKAREKAQADAEVDRFALSGSDSQADVLESQGQQAMFSKRADSNRGFTVADNPTSEEIAEANRQYDAVVAKYKDSPLWMKAPNGQPTKLTERQWVQVRTENFKRWAGDWEIANAYNFAVNGDPVVALTGKEFPPDGEKLTDKVPRFYQEEFGGKATNPEVGDVRLDLEGVKDSLGHGMSREKAVGYAAVPAIIENGYVFNREENRLGRGYDTAVIIAPLTIGGERYIGEVVVRKLKNDNVFYLHEIEITKRLADAFKTPTEGSAPKQVSRLIMGKHLDAVKNASKVTDENGEPKVVYHGTARADRVADVFRPDRATSGPMAFFTDDRGIADNYARDKQDTSLSREDMDDFRNWFQYTDKKGRVIASISDVWNSLTAREKDRLARLAPTVTMDDDYENVVSKPGNRHGTGGYVQNFRESRGNHLEALVKEWLESGTLYDREEDFMEVLRLAGLDMERVQYLNPDFRDEKTYAVFMRMRNPLVTKAMPDGVVDALRERAAIEEESYDPAEGYAADSWDKTGISPKEWMDRFEDDLKDGTTYSWTRIPDWVTDVIKAHGYDGIQDEGNKGGNAWGHTVYIPFESTDVKDAEANAGTFSAERDSILYQKNEGQQQGRSKVADIEKAIASDPVNRIATVVQSVSDLPGNVGRDAPGVVEGAFVVPNGKEPKVYIIADNVTPERAAEVARHEVIGHYGMERMLGKDLMDKTVDQVVYALNHGNKVLNDLADEVDRTQPGLDERTRAKEVIAVMAERNMQNSVVRRVLNAIRRFLAKIGLVKSDITDAEVADLLRKAREHLLESGRDMVGGDVVAQGLPKPKKVVLDRETRSRLARSWTKRLDAIHDAIGVKSFVEKSVRDIRDGKKTLEQHFKDLEAFKKRSDRADEIAEIEGIIEDLRREEDGQSGEVAFSKDSFERNIDEAIAGTRSIVNLGMPPKVLVDAGVANVRLQISSDVINKMKDRHNLTVGQIKRLPELLKSPIMVFRSATEGGHVVVVDDVAESSRGKMEPVIVSIRPNGNVTINYIRSAYARNNFANAVERWVNDGLLVSAQKETATDLLDLYSQRDTSAAGQKINSSDVKSIPQSVVQKGNTSGENTTALFSKQQPISNQAQSSMDMSRKAFDVPDVTRFDNIRRAMQDRMLDIKKVQDAIEKDGGVVSERENVYRREELYASRLDARIKRIEKDSVAPILEAVKESKMSLEEVDQWLAARHVLLDQVNDRLAAMNPNHPDRDRLSGMSDAEAQAVFHKGAGNQALYRVGDLVDKLTRRNVQQRVVNGLMTQAEADQWLQYRHYVPLKRDSDGAGVPKSRGFMVKGPESKRRMGSTLAVKDVLANLFADTVNVAQRIEKARVTRSLLDLARNHPNDDFWKVDQPKKVKRVNKDTGLVETVYRDENMVPSDDVLVVKENGIEHWIKFNTKNERALRIAEAMRNMDVDDVKGVVGAIGRITRYMGGWMTQKNPAFMFSNFLRDIQDAAFNLADTPIKGKEGQLIARIPAAMRAIWHMERGTVNSNTEMARYAREFRDAGGETAYLDLRGSIKEQAEALNKRLKELADDGTPSIKKTLRAVGGVIEHANSSVENSVRLATFVTARKAGLSLDAAASLAKNITVNFNRKGTSTRVVNSLYLFANANVQGHARMLRALVKSRRGRIVAGVLVGVSFALSMLGRASMGDGWDDLPEWEKANNWIMPVGGSNYLKVPIGPGLKLFHYAGMMLEDMMFGKSKRSLLETAFALALTVVDNFNVLGSAGSPGQLISPTVARPIVQLWENKSWTGKPVHREPAPFGGYNPPAYANAFKTTPVHWKKVSKLLNDVSGGDDVTPGYLNFAPESISLAMKAWLIPGTVNEVDRALTAVERVLGDDVAVSPRMVPLLNRVYGQVTEGSSEQRFYKEVEEMRQAVHQIKEYDKQGRDADMDRALKRFGDGDIDKGWDKFDRFNDFMKELRTLNKERREAQKAGDQAEVDAINVDRAKLYKAFTDGRPLEDAYR